MYESSCSYQSALDLKRAAPSPSNSIIKTEDFGFAQNSADWSSYRFHQSTFEQLKQSVEKAKAALQDRTFLGTTSAFSDLYAAPRLNEAPENISSNTLSNNIHNTNNNNNNLSINSNNINSSPLANGTNGSSQSSAVNQNHPHSNGLTNQRHNSASQQHESSLESSKSRQQSESRSLKVSNWKRRLKNCTSCDILEPFFSAFW